MITLITRLSEVAEVSQGLALSGRGVGAQAGDWRLRMVESRDVSDDRLRLDGLREVGVVRSVRTERHLLRPFDVLVTARAGRPEAALVPPRVSRTVAGITLLAVRPRHPESGMGQYLWFYLTSADGRAQLARKTRPGITFTSLSARDLGEMVVPTPPPPHPGQGGPPGRVVGAGLRGGDGGGPSATDDPAGRPGPPNMSHGPAKLD